MSVGLRFNFGSKEFAWLNNMVPWHYFIFICQLISSNLDLPPESSTFKLLAMCFYNSGNRVLETATRSSQNIASVSGDRSVSSTQH